MYRAFAAGPLGISAGFEESVELAARHDFEGIYTDASYLAQKGPAATRQLLEQKGLKPAGWGLPVPFASEDEEEFQKSLDGLQSLCELCAELGDLRTCTWVLPFSDERPFEEQFQFLKERFARIGKVLAPYGARLGLEFIGPQTARKGHAYEFAHTMDGMLELCDAIGTGNIGLLLDCWHLYTSGGSMEDVLELSDEQVVNVHINDAPAGVAMHELVDNVRALPGETGVIDVKGFLRALDQIGYSGPVMAEPFSEKVRQMPAEEAVRVTKEAIDSVWPG